MYPDLYLMRHGQTEWNAAGRLQGRKDSPLTSLGIQQALRLRDITAGIEAQRFASPQGRALASARLIFDTRGFQPDPRLAEIDIGDFTGGFHAELTSRWPETFAGGPLDWYDRAPGGEGFARLEARARAFLDDLGGPALIVTHGVTMMMLQVLARGLGTAHLAETTARQGACYVIRAGGRHEIWT